MKTKSDIIRGFISKLLQALVVATLILLSSSGYAQQGVSVNTTGSPADPSAMLDVSSASKGLLIPRVALTSISDLTTIPNPVVSLLVYNTNASMTGGGTGFWYFNGTIWVQALGPQGIQGPTGAIGATGATGADGATGAQGIQGVPGATGAAGSTGPQGLQGLQGVTGATGADGAMNGWSLLGNSGTSAGTNFIGTTDAQDLAMKTNDIEKVRINAGGNVGIGTTSPAQKLDVQGGNINTSGSLMTGGTARLDAAGNLINIGNITANGASTYTTGAGSLLALQGGNSTTGMGGAVTLTAGTSTTNTAGANVSLYGGPGGYNGTGGSVTMNGGTGGQSGGSGAYITVNGGGPNYGPGGNLVLSGGLQGPGNWWDPGRNGSVIMAINGTEYMRVDGYRDGYQGYVGIGTSVPAAKLDIIGNIKITDGTQGANKVLTSDANGLATWQTASVAGWSLLGNSGTTAGTNFIGTTDAIDFVIKTNNSEKIRVASGGNVGIGTSSPTAKLELSGGLKVTGGMNTDKIISLTGGNNSGTGLGGDVNITGGPGYNMRGGNINITAGYTSSWSGAGTSTDVFIKGGIMESTSSYASIQVGGGKAAVGGTQETAGGDLTLSGGNANLGNRNGGKIILIPGTASGTGTPGNVGIGTTSPGQKLDVQGGNVNTSGSLMTGGTARLDAAGNLINIGNITAAGASTYTTGAGSLLALQGGNSTTGMGGAITLTAGTSTTNTAGANVSLYGGPGGYNGTGGSVTMNGGTGGQSGGSGAYITVNGGGPNYGPGGNLVLSGGLQGPGNWWDPGRNGSVIMAINGTEYMRVDGYRDGYQGYVGIGTSVPAAKLDIIGNIKITDGTQGANKVLTSDANGLASWVTPTYISPAHYVGELYGGGIVFWVSPDNQHGLIMSLDDVSNSAAWSNITATAVGNANDMYDGLANTNAIVAQSGHTSSAAQLCLDYISGGFDDWYLPASWQISQIYHNAYTLNYVLINDGNAASVPLIANSTWPSVPVYWSSTEDLDTLAWSQYFQHGDTRSDIKSLTYRVRGVRSF
ncbi:MAG TPA: hypothetical protein PKN48_10750 [Bacteroidales bacterium]|nr:hypothetical protein [Bacteroidales bacterium]